MHSIQENVLTAQTPQLTFIENIVNKRVQKEALTCLETLVHWFLTAFSCCYPAYDRLYQEKVVEDSTRRANAANAIRTAGENQPAQHLERDEPLRPMDVIAEQHSAQTELLPESETQNETPKTVESILPEPSFEPLESPKSVNGLPIVDEEEGEMVQDILQVPGLGEPWILKFLNGVELYDFTNLQCADIEKEVIDGQTREFLTLHGVEVLFCSPCLDLSKASKLVVREKPVPGYKWEVEVHETGDSRYWVHSVHHNCYKRTSDNRKTQYFWSTNLAHEVEDNYLEISEKVPLVTNLMRERHRLRTIQAKANEAVDCNITPCNGGELRDYTKMKMAKLVKYPETLEGGNGYYLVLKIISNEIPVVPSIICRRNFLAPSENSNVIVKEEDGKVFITEECFGGHVTFKRGFIELTNLKFQKWLGEYRAVYVLQEN